MMRPSALLLPTAPGRVIARITGRATLTTPIVVGATGGSGTRAVHQVLARAGLFMGRDEALNAAGDAMIFEPFLDEFINPILQHTRTLNYQLEALPGSFRKQLRGEFSKVVRRYLQTRSRYSLHWGWKNPRSMYLLPLIRAQFPEFKFIHVVRDGRDMAVSINQNQYLKHYTAAFDAVSPGDNHAFASFRLWCKVNGEVATFGEEVLGRNYLRLRLEDYVEKPAQEIARILSFTGMDENAAADLAGLVQRPDTLGRWRRDLAAEPASQMQSLGADVLSRFGYAQDAADG
jgi:Sulfotransferase family